MEKQKCPEIRFKGFKGDWEHRRLSEIATMYARIGWQNLRTSEFLDRGDYLLITGTDFNDGKINYSTCHYVEKERYEQDRYIQIRNGSILITKDGTLGKVAYVQGLSMPATLNAGVFNVEIKNPSNINGLYLFQYLKAPYLMNYVDMRATGGTIKHLNQNILVDFPVVISTLEEQTQIGNFFQNLDQSITLQEKKLTQTQNLKKAMLEKMFPKAESMQPEIRLKGFSGDWEAFGLFDVAVYKNGKSHESDVVDRGKYIIVNSKFISTDSIVRKFCDSQIEPLYKGNIVFVLSDVPNGKALSKAFLIDADEKYTLNQRIACITPNRGVDAYFLYILINRNPYFLKFDDGVGQTNLSLADMENFVALYPCNEEQIAIGQFFNQLDEILVLQQQQLQTLKNLKQAFLEKMFV